MAPIDSGPELLRRPFGFHLTLLDLSRGQRGITPAFGYGAPHPSTSGTSTHLSTSLPSAHYSAVRLLEDIQAGRVALAFTRRPAARFGCRCSRGLPVLVHEVSRRVWGLRLRRTGLRLALTPLVILPSANSRTSAS